MGGYGGSRSRQDRHRTGRSSLEAGRNLPSSLAAGRNLLVARPSATKTASSVGDITALGNLTWKSSKPDVARMADSSVVAASLGQSDVTVERKGLDIGACTGERFQHDCRGIARGPEDDRDVPEAKASSSATRSTFSAATWT